MGFSSTKTPSTWFFKNHHKVLYHPSDADNKLMQDHRNNSLELFESSYLTVQYLWLETSIN